MDGLSGSQLNRKNVTESEHVLSVTNDVATFTKRACELQTASGHKQRPTPCFFPRLTKTTKTRTVTTAFAWTVAPTDKGDRGCTGVHGRSAPPSRPDGTDTDSKVQIFHRFEPDNVDFWRVGKIPLEISVSP